MLNAAFAIAILDLISHVHLPSFVNTLHKYLIYIYIYMIQIFNYTSVNIGLFSSLINIFSIFLLELSLLFTRMQHITFHLQIIENKKIMCVLINLDAWGNCENPSKMYSCNLESRKKYKIFWLLRETVLLISYILLILIMFSRAGNTISRLLQWHLFAGLIYT